MFSQPLICLPITSKKNTLALLGDGLFVRTIEEHSKQLAKARTVSAVGPGFRGAVLSGFLGKTYLSPKQEKKN